MSRVAEATQKRGTALPPPPADLLRASGPVRLDRLLSNLGLCTRSQAKAFLKHHAVELNNSSGRKATNAKKKPASLSAATKVQPAEVVLDGQPLRWVDPIHLLLHKPVDYVCSHSEAGQASCFDLLPDEMMAQSPAPTSAGRLDKMASGLLVITQAGALVHALTSPTRHLPKVYDVTIEGSELDAPSGSEAAAFASGDICLRDREGGEMVPCKPAHLEYISPTVARITLREGRYHQLRRMMASLGHHVVGIHRVSLGPLALGDLPAGHWRELTDQEVLMLWGAAHGAGESEETVPGSGGAGKG